MDKLIHKLTQQLENKLPFVGYKLPNDTLVKSAYQNDDTLHLVSDYSESGFVFAPFNSNLKTILIPFTHTQEVRFKAIKVIKNKVEATVTDDDKSAHCNLVSKGVTAIKTGEFQKIVLSRAQKETISTPNPITLFKKLLNTYPNAFVYLWYHPKVGCWLGATPETLLRTRGNNFKTMSLAGTQKYVENAVWKVKEQHEQQLVTNYIASCLQKEQISFNASEPYTVKAGNLAHIRTDITGTLTDNNLSKIISVLHPTPAICGLPKEKAKQFILDNEGYDREYYTGFLGELNSISTRKNNRRNTENHAYQFTTKLNNLFVNLRCMQVQQNSIIVYVGGGITTDSIPNFEYQETVDKANTMRAVFE